MLGPSTWVVTVHVWTDRDPALVRVLVGTPAGGDPDEFVGTSVEDACDWLASYLRDRLGS